MSRSYNLKKREGKELPPEKLHELLSKIYSDRVADELFHKLMGYHPTEKGGVE